MPTSTAIPRRAPSVLPFVALLAGLVAAGCSSSSISSSQATPPVTPPVSATFTLHYHRPAADYAGWKVTPTAGTVATAQVAATGTDGFGAVYKLTVKSGATSLGFYMGDVTTADLAGTLAVDVSGSVREAWVISGFARAIPRSPPALPGANQAAVYYLRGDGAYAGWGLHLWGDQASNTAWGTPLQPAGTDPDLGEGFLINLDHSSATGNCPAGHICFIVHKGDTKDPGPDITAWTLATHGNIVFVTSGLADIFTSPHVPGTIAISGAGAHLVTRDTLAWDVPASLNATQFEVRHSATAAIAATATDITGGTAIPVTAAGQVSAAILAKAPYLHTTAGVPWGAYAVAPADQAALQGALKEQLVAVARKADGTPVAATQVQTAFALDDLYGHDGALGLTFAAPAGAPTFSLWAPTAQSVKLHVFDAGQVEVAGSPLTLSMASSGVWSTTGQAGWYGGLYRYEVQVYHPTTQKVETVTTTDPYAVSLTANGSYGQIYDLRDPALAPSGWSSLTKPALAGRSDVVLAEGHLRDFSISDATVPAAHRGKYLAFTDSGSDGMAHLQALAQAGVTHLHLLPVFDIASVDEDPASRVDLDSLFATLCLKNLSVPAPTCTQFAGKTVREALQSYAGDSDQQRVIAGYLASFDSFNWGYDPFHYGAPEGSYASATDGPAKILEFRRMVQGLAAAGLRVVMDVVYNHTNAAGPTSDKSVLDKLVPGYYHRLDPATGYVLSNSCCSDTATEHKMMGRLMVDTLVRWARDYKVDGFRFDLMGLHTRQNIVDAQAALAALTPGSDGVDGSKIVLYGEGWTESVMSDRAANADQLHMAGTGVGTFNDRIRDGARGGGPFDNNLALRQNQGFSSGLYLDPNELAPTSITARTALDNATDLIKIGMAGGLGNFRFLTASGSTTWASALGYGGAPAGYTAQPTESVNYVSSHDNAILWDIVQYKMPTGRSMADRRRAAMLAMDVVLLGQGTPFFHLGDEILRSKSLDGNSYDSGDWFNRVDWTLATSAWRSGLPLGVSGAGQTLAAQILGDASIAPASADMSWAWSHVQEMLRIRKSSPLFRLPDAAQVMLRVDFPNGGPSQVPGLVVMTIADGTCAGADLDPQRDGLVVVVNPDVTAHDYALAGATGFTLHALQQTSADPVVRTASFASGTFHVPARTTAVFEQLQSGAQGAGPACNTR